MDTGLNVPVPPAVDKKYAFWRTALILGIVFWFPMLLGVMMWAGGTKMPPLYVELYFGALILSVICLIAAHRIRSSQQQVALLLLKIPFIYGLFMLIYGS